MKKDQYLNFKNTYFLFKECFESDKKISVNEILKITGWKKSTFNTYYNKKLKGKILEKNTEDKNYSIVNIEKYDEESFLRLMSQNQNKSEKPFKKELKYEVEQLLNKAIESAYLAIDIYNRPQTRFRTDGYIVMMIIAWTSLFHAIFEDDGIDYFCKDKNGNDIIIDGDKKTWELSVCIKYTSDISEAVKENIKFLSLLRNKIEHRYVPSIDLRVVSECHAMLNNFENLLVKRYGNGYSLATSLSIPLQLINLNSENSIDSKKEFHVNNFNDIQNFITNYRASLSDEIYNSMEYSFNVYLLPKIVNRQNQADLTIEFLKYDPSDSENNRDILDAIAFIKQKTVQVANQGKYKPLTVCAIVTEKSKKEFKIHHHTKAWKYYGIRKSGYQADGCDTRFCQFDSPHNDYIYTQDWIDRLIDALLDEKIYNAIINYKD